MTDPDPVLEAATKEAKDRALSWLNRRWPGDKSCPVCKNNFWTVTEPLELRPYSGGGLVIGGPVYPLFGLICGSCGNTLLFNAIVSAVVSPESADEAPPPDSVQ